MQEKIDGTFGAIEEKESLLRRLLQDKQEFDQTKVIHFGTEESLTAIALRNQPNVEVIQPNSIEHRINKLENEIETLKTKEKLHSDYFYIPTKNETRDFIQENRRKFIERKMK
jgi:hypothetical protein